MEIIFEVVHHRAGGYTAQCLNARIAGTEAANLQELHDNISAAVSRHFRRGPKPSPSSIQLLMYHDGE